MAGTHVVVTAVVDAGDCAVDTLLHGGDGARQR